MYLDFTGKEDANVEDMRHVGRTGSFVPVENGGGVLWRINEGKRYHVTGTKGYLWIEREIAANKESVGELDVDKRYFADLQVAAVKAIEQFTSFNDLIA